MSSKTATVISVLPSASRLIRSLRDLGYEFPQAVADVVDNSIAAGATRIAIALRFEGPDSWLRISDNGHGMDAEAITEAMRFGSHQEYDDESLGKFGLGLKTASLSQCLELSVSSRRAGGAIQIRKLDLKHVMESNRWEIFAIGPRLADARLLDPLQGVRGTTVLWESLDRVLGYKIPWGKRAQSAIADLVESLRLHLGMTFHRFLAGEVTDRKRLRILLNGRSVEPWDPFARDEPATQVVPGCDVDVVSPEGVGIVRFQPYALPPREGFSSEDAFHRLAGPRKWNAQQGFYVYRANRLIQSGGWCRMRALDEHLKLARAAIDFFPELDSAFEINVAKVRIALPGDLRERLRQPVEDLARIAQTAYRASGSLAKEPRHSTDGRRGAAPFLEDAARRVGALRPLQRIANELRAKHPRVARDLGW